MRHDDNRWGANPGRGLVVALVVWTVAMIVFGAAISDSTFILSAIIASVVMGALIAPALWLRKRRLQSMQSAPPAKPMTQAGREFFRSIRVWTVSTFGTAILGGGSVALAGGDIILLLGAFTLALFGALCWVFQWVFRREQMTEAGFHW